MTPVQTFDFVLAMGKLIRAQLVLKGPDDFTAIVAREPAHPGEEVFVPWMPLGAQIGGATLSALQVFEQVYAAARRTATRHQSLIVEIRVGEGPADLQEVQRIVGYTILVWRMHSRPDALTDMEDGT